MREGGAAIVNGRPVGLRFNPPLHDRLSACFLNHLMSVGPWQILIVALLVALLFGGRRLSRLGYHLGRGTKYLKSGLGGKGEGNVLQSVGEVARTAKEVKKMTRLRFK